MSDLPAPAPYTRLEQLDDPATLQWVQRQNDHVASHLGELRCYAAVRALLLRLQPPPDPDTPSPLLGLEPPGSDSTVQLESEQRSPGGRYVAWGVTRGGSEWQEVRVRAMQAGTDLPEVLTGMRS